MYLASHRVAFLQNYMVQKVRAVVDNLRSLMFLNDHCVEEKVDAVLVSLDTKNGLIAALLQACNNFKLSAINFQIILLSPQRPKCMA